MELPELYQRLAVALGLGLLVGLQREHAESQTAGIRTFALVTLLGAMCGLLSIQTGGWIIGLGALAVAALLVMSNIAKLGGGLAEPGMTTEVAVLVMFVTSAYVILGELKVAVAVGGVVALLLYAKRPLHGLVDRIGHNDIRAIMQFVLIALVILPLLPDRAYGSYQVFNPREIWMMVVLIVGINLGGYVAYKLFGESAGTLLGGVLGGIISSTATTVSYSRRTRESDRGIGHAALVIQIASTIAFGRVLAEIAAVAPGVLRSAGPPLGAMLGWMLLVSAALYYFGRKEKTEVPQQENPAELKPALIFGALYAIIIFAVAAAKEHFGSAGMYVVAIISGLTDVDAITLSTARLSQAGSLTPDSAWRIILIAALSNLVFKAGVVFVLGSRRLAFYVAGLFTAAIAGGTAIFFLWPVQQ